MSKSAGHRVLWAGLGGMGIGIGALSAAHWSQGPAASGDAKVVRALPLNLVGIAAYYVGSVPIPGPLRTPIYKSYCSTVGCDTSEVAGNLRDFRSLAAFFGRSLRPEVRQIDKDATVVVPCDGTVIAVGPVGAYGSIEVKNSSYRIRDLVGASGREPLAVSSVAVANRKESGARLWYTVIHIEPRQCHRFASPTSWDLSERRHIQGYLLWLNPHINRLYTENERLALLGRWDHGLFTMTAVGAAGRGSVRFELDNESFYPQLRPSHSKISTAQYSEPRALRRGEPMGGFRLGSAVVLVFEAPEQFFTFHIKSGETVKLGQRLASIADPETAKSRPDTVKENSQSMGREIGSRARFRRAW